MAFQPRKAGCKFAELHKQGMQAQDAGQQAQDAGVAVMPLTAQTTNVIKAGDDLLKAMKRSRLAPRFQAKPDLFNTVNKSSPALLILAVCA